MNEYTRSIIKTYRKEIWVKFIEAIKKYNLIMDNDKIAVCISGGKDSFLTALLMKELQKHGQINFELCFIMVNPGYKKEYIEHVVSNASKLDIELKILDTNIFDIVENSDSKSNCFVCARLRRGYLYDFAKKNNCNKIALGHHLDDVIETTFLNMFYNGMYETMRPKLNSDNFEGMKLIRPMYLIKEESIIKWVNYNKLEFKESGCGFNKENSKRVYLKPIIKKLREDNKFFDANMIHSLEKINLDKVNGYIKDNNIVYTYED